MVQKFQIVKISGTSYHHVDHSDVISLDFFPFSRDFSPVSFNGYTVFPRFAEGRRSGQVVHQVFQAELDFRAAVAFRENLSALICQFAHQTEHVPKRLRTRDLRRLRDFCFGVRGRLR